MPDPLPWVENYDVEGVRQLARHLIRGAILDFIRYRNTTPWYEQSRAMRWLFEGAEAPLTLEWACDAAEISVHTIRRVALYLEEHPEEADVKLLNDWDA